MFLYIPTMLVKRKGKIKETGKCIFRKAVNHLAERNRK